MPVFSLPLKVCEASLHHNSKSNRLARDCYLAWALSEAIVQSVKSSIAVIIALLQLKPTLSLEMGDTFVRNVSTAPHRT
jgi:MFS superfamily sulfate permease-like transporter